MTTSRKRDKIVFGKPSRDKRGRSGVRVDLRVESGWYGLYHFSSHGMTHEELVAKIATIEAKHEIKNQKLGAYQGLLGKLRGSEVRITDAIIREVGTDAEVFVVAVDGAGRRIDGFPLTLIAPSVEELPTPAEVEAAVLEAVAVMDAAKTDADEVVRQVKKLRGGP